MPAAHAQHVSAISIDAAILQDGMRAVWFDHMFWMREAVYSAMSDKSDRQKIAQHQVRRKAHEISNLLTMYYGKNAAARFHALLLEHDETVLDYLRASSWRNSSATEEAYQRLVKNSAEWARLLGGISSRLASENLAGLFGAHAGFHAVQIQEFLSRDYRKEAATWQTMSEHVRAMADALAIAIFQQFPDRFERSVTLDRPGAPFQGPLVSTVSLEAAALQNNMRAAWVDHVFWVREAVLSTLEGNAVRMEVTHAMAQRNAAQIAEQFLPTYGADAESRVLALVSRHNELVLEYLRAILSKEPGATDKAYLRLLDHSEAMARVLNEINPGLSMDRISTLLIAQAGHHAAQVQQALTGTYDKEPEIWQTLTSHTRAIADALTLATEQRFPEQFERDLMLEPPNRH